MTSRAEEQGHAQVDYVVTDDLRPEGYEGTCLRPLGLCELGGCCDACWYRPDHPRFEKSKGNPKTEGSL